MSRTRLTFDLPNDDAERLRALADRDSRPLASILRMAVSAYLRLRRVPETDEGDAA